MQLGKQQVFVWPRPPYTRTQRLGIHGNRSQQQLCLLVCSGAFCPGCEACACMGWSGPLHCPSAVLLKEGAGCTVAACLLPELCLLVLSRAAS